MILYDGTLSNVLQIKIRESFTDCQLILVRCYFQKCKVDAFNYNLVNC
jgi:hypothetical protein